VPISKLEQLNQPRNALGLVETKTCLAAGMSAYEEKRRRLRFDAFTIRTGRFARRANGGESVAPWAKVLVAPNVLLYHKTGIVEDKMSNARVPGNIGNASRGQNRLELILEGESFQENPLRVIEEHGDCKPRLQLRCRKRHQIVDREAVKFSFIVRDNPGKKFWK